MMTVATHVRNPTAQEQISEEERDICQRFTTRRYSGNAKKIMPA